MFRRKDKFPPRFYITGDKHRRFDELIKFCKKERLTESDTVIILGDTGFNYYGDERDEKLKNKLSGLGVKLFCIHGNKENRAENIPSYGIRSFCGGIVYCEPRFPNIFFAKDGEVYNIEGREFLVCGGANSVDKFKCMAQGTPYFEDEMPDDERKERFETALTERENKIYGILTHTCPLSLLPSEMFISTRLNAQSVRNRKRKKKAKDFVFKYPIDVNRTTEQWLEGIMQKTDFEVWYCGHYHIDKKIFKVRMMHKNIAPLFDEGEL